MEPILLLGKDRFADIDMRIRVKGGGHTSQIYAIRQALSRALVSYYQSLGEGLTDGVDLGSVSAPLDSDPHVDIGESVFPQQEDGLHQLGLQGTRLNQLQRATVHLDQSSPSLAMGHSSGGLL